MASIESILKKVSHFLDPESVVAQTKLNEENLRLSQKNRDLMEEIVLLKKQADLESKMVRHSEMYITLEERVEFYCTHCWDKDKILHQVLVDDEYGAFRCLNCGYVGYYKSKPKEMPTVTVVKRKPIFRG